MKLALITDPKGFKIIDMYDFAYHLVLAQYACEKDRYATYYIECRERGHFLMMDNGAAEDGSLDVDKLLEMYDYVRPDELILPDVMLDMNATVEATMNRKILDAVAPKERAVCPQGNSLDEWISCANYFVENLEFATLCVPKHLERFVEQGGRNAVLNTILKAGWHMKYHIHMLGIWGDARTEILKWRKHIDWIRGIDTALPFALAQNNINLQAEKDISHVSHKWGGKLDLTLASANVNTLWEWTWGYE